MRTIRKCRTSRARDHATVYAPLEKTPFDPHVVVIVTTAGMLKLAQTALYLLGGRIESRWRIQSVCADATRCFSGKINYQLG